MRSFYVDRVANYCGTAGICTTRLNTVHCSIVILPKRYRWRGTRVPRYCYDARTLLVLIINYVGGLLSSRNTSKRKTTYGSVQMELRVSVSL